MAYTIKSSLSGSIVGLVGVDDDGTSIVDFKGNAISLDTGVAGSVATGAWKSMSPAPKYFVCTADTFNFRGVRWTGTRPTVSQTDSDGMGAFIICHAASNCSASPSTFIEFANVEGNPYGLGRVSTADAHGRITGVVGGTFATTATNIPTDNSTKFMFAGNYRSGVFSEVFYGPESGSLASDGTAGDDGGWGATMTLYSIGGDASQGNQPCAVYLAGVMNRPFTLAEYQEIFADWKAFFFDAPGLAGSANMAMGGQGTLTGLSAPILMGQILL